MSSFLRRPRANRLRLEALEDRTLLAGDLVAVGSIVGDNAIVRLVDPTTGNEHLRVTAFEGYNGGVSVACGDVNADGLFDLIVGAQGGNGGHVRVFSGLDGTLLYSFLAFDPVYTGGVCVASGDVDYDGREDIVVGALSSTSHVKVFRGVNGVELSSFLAFDGFGGGVTVACADVSGDARADVIVGAGPGAGAHVKAFNGVTGALLSSFFAFDGFSGGVRVAAGDVDADGFADLITGAGPGAGPHVKAYSGLTGAELSSFFAFAPDYTGGVQPGTCAIDGNGTLDVIVATAAGGPAARVFSGTSGAVVSQLPGGDSGAACTGATVPNGDAILDYNRAARAVIRSTGTPPPRASRALAILHVALYDAVNNITGGHDFYAIDPAVVTPPAGASADAAAAAAGQRVLAALFPAQVATFAAIRTALLDLIPDGASKTDGIAYGETVADQILALRASDGSSTVTPYTPGAEPGQWRPTPPANAPALLPNWPDVTPFAMESGDQFRPAGPPELDTAEYAAAVNEVKALGQSSSATRTPDQTQIALFWADGGGTVTPPGHWNQIADEITSLQGGTLAERARLFALLNIAEADAAIGAWDAKYHYVEGFGLWRPITAIREDDDGNDATTADPTWTPLIATPPFPEYTSGHSTFSGAAATVLQSLLGTTSFFIHTDFLPNVVRQFGSFDAAADEAAASRLYGGIHYTFSNLDGKTSGEALGAYVIQTQLI